MPKTPEPVPRVASAPHEPPRDDSRTRSEARRVYREDGDDSEGPNLTRFTVWDVTSGLPDDSRDGDERSAERRLRDVRASVKAARAALSAHPGAREVLRADWRREAAFYARFGITRAQFRNGVPGVGEGLETNPVVCDPSGREGSP